MHFLPIAIAALTIAGACQSFGATIVPLTLTNPGFESGSTGWTFNNFTITTSARTGTGAIQAGSAINPNAGLANPDATATQTIDLSAQATAIDANQVTVNFAFFVARDDNFDEHASNIEFFDVSNSSLGSTGSALVFGSTGGYIADSIEGAVPVGTRSMIVTLIADIGTAGSSIGVRFDDTSASLSVIPEPSTALLGALGFLALLRRRR